MTEDQQTLVIFDCDGVLVDSEIISVTVDQEVLADLGWSISRDEIIERFVGRSHAHFLEVVEEHIGRKLPNDWEDAYQHLYREALARDLQLVDGIVEALNSINRPTCVASNGSHNKMEFTLKLAGLWPRFEGRIFSAAVEDSPAGVQAALAANMKVIAYAGGISPRKELIGESVTLIEHMGELPQAIEGLFTK